MQPVDPEVVAVALSLYAYNVDAGTRAKATAERAGEPPEEAEYIFGHLVRPDGKDSLCPTDSPFWPTELPHKSMSAYVALALERYQDEAAEQVRINSLSHAEWMREVEQDVETERLLQHEQESAEADYARRMAEEDGVT